MSKVISQNVIKDLLSKVDIANVIGSRIALKRVGKNLVGLCPFHAEKTPSFTVSQPKQFFNCFGCGSHGSAIGFLMQFERIDFIDAVRNLASNAGIIIPRIMNYYKKPQHTELYKITQRICNYYEDRLLQSQYAIRYLRSRGLNRLICKKYRIGYAPNSWDYLSVIYRTSHLIEQQMIDTGILIKKGNQIYSRFWDRVMFPITNITGHVVGFGGRAINIVSSAKYLNSPESSIFHKSYEVYGLYEAIQTNNRLESIIVVEGYFDVISLCQFGISNAVATLGVAISKEQIQLILRYTQEIIFCFDGDQAGYLAAWRALESSLPVIRDGIHIKFLFLPDGYDPDKFIRKESKETFNAFIEKAVSLSDFFVDHLVSKVNINTIDGKAKLIKISQEMLMKMPKGIFYQLLSKKISEIVHINTEELVGMDSNYAYKNVYRVKKNNKMGIHVFVQKIINILLHCPELVCHINDLHSIEKIELDGIGILIKLIVFIKNNPDVSLGYLLEYCREKEEFIILNDLVWREPIIPKEVLKEEFIALINSLKQLEVEQKISLLLSKVATDKLGNKERIELQNLIEISKKKG